MIKAPCQKKKLLVTSHGFTNGRLSLQCTEHFQKTSVEFSSFRPRIAMTRNTVVFVLLACIAMITVGTHASGSHREKVGSRHLLRHGRRVAKKHETYLNEIVVNLGESDQRLAVALADRYGLLFKGEVSIMHCTNVIKTVPK